jgi:hypothetical protein
MNDKQSKFNDHKKKLKDIFESMTEELQLLDDNPENFKKHSLPLARIKKIMKSDGDVKVESSFYVP